MKILHIIDSVNPVRGGPVGGIRSLSQEMKVRGHSVSILCGDDPKSPYVKSFDADVIALGPSFLNYGFNTRLVSWLLSNSSAYDLIIINGIWQFHSFAAGLALFWLRKDYYLFTHGMLDPWFQKNYPYKHIKKLLYWILFERHVVNRAKAVLFTCDEECRLARQSFPFYSARELVVAYGSPVIARAPESVLDEFLRKFPLCRDKKNILFIGRVHEKKGCDLLIEAFYKLSNQAPDVHLIIAGPYGGSYYGKLCQLIDRLGVNDKITWTGMLEGDMKAAAFQISSVFCLPSHQENFGIVVSEALSFGVPVLISNKVNIWREIEASGAGFVADDSVVGTYESLERWYKLSSYDREIFSRRANDCYLKNFSIESSADSLVALF